MKKFLLLFAVVAMVGVSASAQKCTKSKTACTKSKTTCTKAKKATLVSTDAELPACPTKAAAVLASQNENIEAKTCASSGMVSYYKKNVCETSGKVSMEKVKYCSESKAFVNVAPPAKAEAVKLTTSGSAAKKSCAKKCTKNKTSCTAKKGEAKTVSLNASETAPKKSCAKKCTKDKTSCTAKKAATLNNATAPTVKQVSLEEK